VLNGNPIQRDALGRLVAINPGVVVAFNGGTPMGLLASLQVVGIGSVAHNGLLYDAAGHLAVANGGIIANHVQGGLPVDSTGKLCVEYDDAIAYYLAGIPFNAAGRVVLTTPVNPVDLYAFSNAFSNAFDVAGV
jgi:hypothetical protein